MVRTQIQLTEKQASALRTISATRQISIAQLIRESVDSFIRREAASNRETIVARAKSAAGRFASGTSDASSNHHNYVTAPATI